MLSVFIGGYSVPALKRSVKVCGFAVVQEVGYINNAERCIAQIILCKRILNIIEDGSEIGSFSGQTAPKCTFSDVQLIRDFFYIKEISRRLDKYAANRCRDLPNI